MKLFLSEESPSLIGLGAQDHLHAKSSWPSYSAGAGSDDNLPPGFEGTHPANVLHDKLSQIPVIQWKCPPRVRLLLTVSFSTVSLDSKFFLVKNPQIIADDLKFV